MEDGYLYTITSKEIKKINNISFKYIPYINEVNSGILDSTEINSLINSKVLLIKKPNIFYGYTIIKNIIIKKSNENLYNMMVKKYNICELYNLYFIEYDRIIKFKYNITLKDLNEIKLPKMHEYNLLKYDCNKIIKMITNIIDEKKKIDSDESSESETELELESKLENDKDMDIMIMKIPILWIPCNKLKKNIDSSKINRKMFISHYTKCELCEINNNNRINIDLNNNLLFKECCIKPETVSVIPAIPAIPVIPIISVIDDEIEEIIDKYQKTLTYKISKNKYNEYEYDENKINLIYNKDINEKYKGCIFILYS